VTVDFDWGDDAEALRAEVRAFLEDTLTPELEERIYRSGVLHDQGFAEALARRGWIAPDWERGDGLPVLDPFQVHVLTEELTRADAPIYATSTSMMAASVIRAAGSEELKAEVLPRVVRGEVTIALGMTEPEAGSDVAAVRTRARRDGDDWVIDGQKMFTTNGHVCDYVFLLTRTDPDQPRHAGLTTFLVPLDHPGIEVQALYTLSGERTNITYYKDVRIDDRWRVGEVDRGWHTLMLALQDEHSAPFTPHLARVLEAAERWAATTSTPDERPRLAEDDVRVRLARAATAETVGSLLEARTTWMEARHDVPVAEGPMAKLFGTEAMVRHSEDLAELVGADALRSRYDPTAPERGMIEHVLRLAVGSTIYAGTSEIQRNIIAQHACGLPRS
jgi:alkylation response protein AidB-like acyl-CoA dehydrogenase